MSRTLIQYEVTYHSAGPSVDVTYNTRCPTILLVCQLMSRTLIQYEATYHSAGVSVDVTYIQYEVTYHSAGVSVDVTYFDTIRGDLPFCWSVS